MDTGRGGSPVLVLNLVAGLDPNLVIVKGAGQRVGGGPVLVPENDGGATDQDPDPGNVTAIADGTNVLMSIHSTKLARTLSVSFRHLQLPSVPIHCYPAQNLTCACGGGNRLYDVYTTPFSYLILYMVEWRLGRGTGS